MDRCLQKHRGMMNDTNDIHESPIKDVILNIGKLGRSELELAAAEFKEASDHVRTESKSLIGGAVAVILGSLPLMAFLVIGLGRMLDGNYWLSSLITGLLFTGIGGAVAYSSFQRIELQKLSFPRTRDNLRADTDVVSKAVHIHLAKGGSRQ
jgi:hypothetical protein